MISPRWLATLASIVLTASTGRALTLAPIHAQCSIGPSDHAGQFSLRVWEGDCDGDRHCSSNFNHDPFSRLSGITRADLARDGATLTATMAAEAGTFTCAGTVQEGMLTGNATFTPDQAFVDRMEHMGFSGYTTEKLEGYAFIGVESAWVKSLQQTDVKGLTTDNLLALRIFNVDPEYIRSITGLGYAMPDADKLIALRVQKVDPEEVRQIRALGLQPTLDELIQIRIFGITPEFVRNMQSRGLKDLTIAKLVQIKIFKLDE
jgi:hypothetical protein